jgi:hypothetical protein
MPKKAFNSRVLLNTQFRFLFLPLEKAGMRFKEKILEFIGVPLSKF